MLKFLTPCFAILITVLCVYFLISPKPNIKKIKCESSFFRITIIFNAKHKTKKR